ncbi:MAG TPA: YCF48-related protein, partial [Nevskiaceae bacterium]|nr:YCF48-related protein [Nevskiaceae bacterium]
VGHDAVILHTADGGKTWKLQNFQPELEKPLLSVLCTDAKTCFAVGAYGLFKKTVDGEHWTDVDAPAIRADELHFNQIARLHDGSLFIAGEQGMLGHSTDGGNTWTKITSPYDASLFGALPVGEKGALIFGLRGNAYVTQDVAKAQWTKIETGTVSSFFGGTTLPNGELALVGLNGVLLVTDANGGNVHTVKVTFKEIDKNGQQTSNELSSTLSAAIPFGGGMVLVGEQGVQNLASVQ